MNSFRPTTTMPNRPLPSTVASSRIELSTGTLRVWNSDPGKDFGGICCFGARLNPRRGFLFVSKVNGRYRAVPPSVLDEHATALAESLSSQLPGPVAFVGISEAGIAVGSSVFGTWIRRANRSDCIFVQSTRQVADSATAFSFEEKHSHARHHRVYVPRKPAARQLLQSARTLVLIDDEITTGRTMAYSVLAARNFCAELQTVRQVTLMDWSGGNASFTNGSITGLHTTTSALWTGTYDFQKSKTHPRIPDPTVSEQSRRMVLRVDAECAVGQTLPSKFVPPTMKGPAPQPGERVLVIGTGEFQVWPLALARYLEQIGCEAVFQTTTRAPVKIEAAIENRFELKDTYGGDFPCFLYNVHPAEYDRVLFCVEDDRQVVCEKLLEALNAEVVFA